MIPIFRTRLINARIERNLFSSIRCELYNNDGYKDGAGRRFFISITSMNRIKRLTINKSIFENNIFNKRLPFNHLIGSFNTHKLNYNTTSNLNYDPTITPSITSPFALKHSKHKSFNSHQFSTFRNQRYSSPSPIIIGGSEGRGPSLKTSLLLLTSTLLGVFLYCSYKVGYRGEAVFIPLWISSKKRSPYKSEINTQKFIDDILNKLHNRLSVDEEVNRLLGVAIEFCHEPEEEEKYEIHIRSSSPGITGLMIEPSPTYKISFTSRPFSSPSSGIDRLLQPFLPGEADSEDANTFPGDRPSFYEAVLDGKIKLRSCRGVNNKGYHHSINEATLQFRASRSISHTNAAPRFSNTILTYKDSHGNEVVTRLW